MSDNNGLRFIASPYGGGIYVSALIPDAMGAIMAIPPERRTRIMVETLDRWWEGQDKDKHREAAQARLAAMMGKDA